MTKDLWWGFAIALAMVALVIVLVASTAYATQPTERQIAGVDQGIAETKTHLPMTLSQSDGFGHDMSFELYDVKRFGDMVAYYMKATLPPLPRNERLKSLVRDSMRKQDCTAPAPRRLLTAGFRIGYIIYDAADNTNLVEDVITIDQCN